MKGHGTKFGRKMEAAIAALLTKRNIDEAAKAVGISPNTLLNWMKVPEFQVAYREARKAAYSQAVAKLQQGATAAATTLLKVMVDQSTPVREGARRRVRHDSLHESHGDRGYRSQSGRAGTRGWNSEIGRTDVRAIARFGGPL